MLDERQSPGRYPASAAAVRDLPTMRTACEQAFAVYALLGDRAMSNQDPRVQRVAEKAYQRGLATLRTVKYLSSDVSLSEHAADALMTYLQSAYAATGPGELMWLGMLPEAMVDIYRDAIVQVAAPRMSHAGMKDQERAAIEDRPDEFRAANRQKSLALAA